MSDHNLCFKMCSISQCSQQMVTQNTLRTSEGFFTEDISTLRLRFPLNQCFQQIKLPTSVYTCAFISEIQSYISSRFQLRINKYDTNLSVDDIFVRFLVLFFKLAYKNKKHPLPIFKQQSCFYHSLCPFIGQSVRPQVAQHIDLYLS